MTVMAEVLETPEIGDHVRRRQRDASDPAASVWVSANAGAGKTKVLTDRVIRLMLDGSPPARILCLTFTKAAAAEMTIRVFRTLAAWVTIPEAALAAALHELCGLQPDGDARRTARRLFARAVETPGGLKIETIHAFCERVLHLVPFEAEAPPRFSVLDDGEAAELMAESQAAILTRAASRRPEAGGLAAALDAVASQVTGDRLVALIGAAATTPGMPAGEEAIESAVERLRAAFDLAAGETSATIQRSMIDDGFAAGERREVLAALAGGSKTDGEQARRLRAAVSPATPVEVAVASLRAAFRTSEGQPRTRLATAAVGPQIRDLLERERTRFEGLLGRLLGAETVERSAALYRLSAAVRVRYAEIKAARGALDFADLIAKTLALLESGKADWVLFRLDRGIDHVLVDEAQDTNAEQWRILQLLTEEFTAGAGRPIARPRTLFAVGDPKQSIYSFQGADPRLFEDSRQHWKREHAGADLPFRDVALDVSFRSAKLVLDAVDHTFAVAAHFRGLSYDSGVSRTSHVSHRLSEPGHVEIWPTELPIAIEREPDAWARPLDAADPDSPAVRIAKKAARAITRWTTTGDAATGRVWRPGEILVLARKRGPAFFAIIRELKAAGIRVAGADRIDINDEIAVNDLVAAGQAALLPRNDLALAAALKSPLVGLDDDDLIRIAADRGEAEPLAHALERLAATDARARRGAEALADWRALAASEGPFGFYATLLGPRGGRRRLVERLGGEAADAIDTFLCQARADERTGDAPSLTAFLARFETARHVIRRDPEQGTDEVRVMTVHGAKGLEAPLVLVLDGCDVLGQDPALIAVPAGGGAPLPVWALGKGQDAPALAKAREAMQARGREEHNRLLYVALTRARDRLVIAPFAKGPPRKNGVAEPEDAWCSMVRRGFAEAVQHLVPIDLGYGPVEIWRDEARWTKPKPEAPATPLAAPGWLTAPAQPEPEERAALRPSGTVGGARWERPSPARAEARRRGVILHALVHHLANILGPGREAAADAYVMARAGGLAPDVKAELARDALRLLADPALAGLFGPGSRGEVAITGRVGPPGREREVSGQIDRLAIGSEVLVADFKTGAALPRGDLPAGYLAQLALYRALLMRLHPDRQVRALLVWVADGTVVEPDPAALDRALDDVLDVIPDAPVP